MSTPTRPPAVSVVIPALNERRTLAGCLDSVLRALAPIENAEVLVVDGGSVDGTLEVAGEYASRHRAVRVLHNPHRVTAAAFNLAIQASRGLYVAILSAHSDVDPDFFSRAIAALEAGVADVVGGPVRTEPGGPGALAWLLAQIVSHRFGVGNSRFRVSLAPGYVDALPFALFRRDVFSRVGPFREDLPRNQDTEFFGRVGAAGIRVYLDPSIRSSYHARGSLGGLLHQAFRSGYWNVLVWRITPRAFRLRHVVPGAFVVALIVTSLAAVGVPGWWVAPAALVGSYTVAALLATAQVATRQRRAVALALPPLFVLYHATYGLGSVLGLHWLLTRHRRSAAQ